MSPELTILATTAVTIGFLHTLTGPDHYLPFIVIARARDWSLFKTTLVTVACGIGHVGSSVVLGLTGIAFGIGISRISFLESFRGNLAAYAFMLFGLGYMLWGWWRIKSKKPHRHLHIHADGTMHDHDHIHANDHSHEHKKNITPWILFIIFVLGPCEPLIPLLMYPAATNSTGGMIMVTILFALTTILTMVVIVILATYGIQLIPFHKAEKYMHVIAGATILISGAAIRFLGL